MTTKKNNPKHDAQTKTYAATVDGRQIRCTVPEDPKPEEILVDALRDCLSPSSFRRYSNGQRRNSFSAWALR